MVAAALAAVGLEVRANGVLRVAGEAAGEVEAVGALPVVWHFVEAVEFTIPELHLLPLPADLAIGG